MVIQVVAALILFIAAVEGAGSAATLANSLHIGAKTMASTVFAVGIVLFFLLFYGYFVFFEKLWNGQRSQERRRKVFKKYGNNKGSLYNVHLSAQL